MQVHSILKKAGYGLGLLFIIIVAWILLRSDAMAAMPSSLEIDYVPVDITNPAGTSGPGWSWNPAAEGGDGVLTLYNTPISLGYIHAVNGTLHIQIAGDNVILSSTNAGAIYAENANLYISGNGATNRSFTIIGNEMGIYVSTSGIDVQMEIADVQLGITAIQTGIQVVALFGNANLTLSNVTGTIEATGYTNSSGTSGSALVVIGQSITTPKQGTLTLKETDILEARGIYEPYPSFGIKTIAFISGAMRVSAQFIGKGPTLIQELSAYTQNTAAYVRFGRTTPTIPQTGDSSHPRLYLFVTLLTAGVLVLFFRRRYPVNSKK